LCDEPTEYDHNVHLLADNRGILDNLQFNRMTFIEAINCIGGYDVTKLDGSIIEIMGYH
jgi:hypothetical protein